LINDHNVSGILRNYQSGDNFRAIVISDAFWQLLLIPIALNYLNSLRKWKEIMKTETIVKATVMDPNHKEKLASNTKSKTLTVRTGIRAGDVYMQNPRGSNNRLREQ
jgi:Trm5-related predicted tRNA methylase